MILNSRRLVSVRSKGTPTSFNTKIMRYLQQIKTGRMKTDDKHMKSKGKRKNFCILNTYRCSFGPHIHGCHRSRHSPVKPILRLA